MRYHVKKPDTLYWSVLDTTSLSAEVNSGRINWNWRIRRDGESRDWSVLELAEAQQYSVGISGRTSEETRSRTPPVNALCYLLIGDQQTGPYTPDQVRSMWTNGQITADTLYWFEGLKEWQLAKNFCQSLTWKGSADNEVDLLRQVVTEQKKTFSQLWGIRILLIGVFVIPAILYQCSHTGSD